MPRKKKEDSTKKEKKVTRKTRVKKEATEEFKPEGRKRRKPSPGGPIVKAKYKKTKLPADLGDPGDKTPSGQYPDVWAIHFQLDVPGYPIWTSKPYGKTKQDAYDQFIEWAMRFYPNVARKTINLEDIIIHSIVPFDEYLRDKNIDVDEI